MIYWQKERGWQKYFLLFIALRQQTLKCTDHLWCDSSHSLAWIVSHLGVNFRHASQLAALVAVCDQTPLAVLFSLRLYQFWNWSLNVFFSRSSVQQVSSKTLELGHRKLHWGIRNASAFVLLQKNWEIFIATSVQEGQVALQLWKTQSKLWSTSEEHLHLLMPPKRLQFHG